MLGPCTPNPAKHAHNNVPQFWKFATQFGDPWSNFRKGTGKGSKIISLVNLGQVCTVSKVEDDSIAKDLSMGKISEQTIIQIDRSDQTNFGRNVTESPNVCLGIRSTSDRIRGIAHSGEVFPYHDGSMGGFRANSTSDFSGGGFMAVTMVLQQILWGKRHTS